MSKPKRLPDKLLAAARAAAVAAVALSTWLFGSAEPWAYLFICILVGAGVAAWLLALISEVRSGLRAPLLTLALAALLAYVLLQMIPLPSGLVRVASPLSADSQLAQAELFERTGVEEFFPAGLNDDRRRATISASSAATRRSFYLLAAYVGVFLVTANAFREWAQVRRAATVVVASSFALAVLGTIHKFSGSAAIFWFHTPRFGGAIFGPFTNPNHYAAYMNMAFGLALGLVLAASATPRFPTPRTWEAPPLSSGPSGRPQTSSSRATTAHTRNKRSLREKLDWLSTGEAGRVTLLGFAAALMGASVCVSLSRGGITSLAVSLGVVGVIVALRSAVAKRARAVAAVALLIVAVVVWLGWEPVVRELSTLAEIDPASNVRTEATLATLRTFAASPAFGCGFGSFQHVFPKFQSPSIQIGRWLHAHNEYAQLLAEGGIVGALLALLAGVLFIRTVRTQFSEATNGARLFAGGLTVGLVAIALHSFVDYSLHKPANAFLLATLCGMSVAAVHLRSERKKRRSRRRRDHEFRETSKKQAELVVAGVS